MHNHEKIVQDKEKTYQFWYLAVRQMMYDRTNNEVDGVDTPVKGVSDQVENTTMHDDVNDHPKSADERPDDSDIDADVDAESNLGCLDEQDNAKKKKKVTAEEMDRHFKTLMAEEVFSFRRTKWSVER